jgi:hydrogenase/urease accessory protein HupE
VRRFVPSGVHHILIGPDHLLFLVGLLLLGGSIRQLIAVVTAFTVAHSITLSLAALSIVTPPARVVEPAIALSIVYVGADNLMVHGGRDVRAWIAFA